MIGANATQSDFVAVLFFDVSERSNFISAFIIRRTVLLFFYAKPQIREFGNFSWHRAFPHEPSCLSFGVCERFNLISVFII